MRLWHIEKIQDPHEVWIDLFRGKTGGERRFALWPETKQAIVDYLAIRPKPAIGVDAELLFLNQQGRPWVNSKSNAHFDGIGTRFSELRKAAGIPRGTFYDLRRTFATIASETNDTEGLRHLMGFVAPKNDMLAEYIQAVFDYRLKRITDHVREWLFGKPSRKPSQKRGAK
jgi:integrase